MNKSQVIEILKGLLTPYKEIDSRSMDNIEMHDRSIFNQAVSEQNAKIQAVIDRLGKE